MTATKTRRRFLTRRNARFRVALATWVALGLVAVVLYSRRFHAETLEAGQLIAAVLVAGFSGMLGYFAWLMYVPTIERTDDIPVARILSGLATLVPPCVIGVSILPAGSSVIPWFVAGGLVVGGFALLSPHQEYLFARTNRLALARTGVDWGTVSVPDSPRTAPWPEGVPAARVRDLPQPETGPQPGFPEPQPTPAVRSDKPAREANFDSNPGHAAVDESASTESHGGSALELTDSTDTDGVRCLEGEVAAVFQPGQKRAYVHVPFSPTFETPPEVLCEPVDDSGARIRTPRALQYGVRLEVTLPSPADEVRSVRLSLLVRASG